jgi:hypothetical protein
LTPTIERRAPAEKASGSLAAALEQDITRNLGIVDLSIQLPPLTAGPERPATVGLSLLFTRERRCRQRVEIAVAERIRAAIESLALPHLGSPAGCMTISVGAVSNRPRPPPGTAPASPAIGRQPRPTPSPPRSR